MKCRAGKSGIPWPIELRANEVDPAASWGALVSHPGLEVVAGAIAVEEE